MTPVQGPRLRAEGWPDRPDIPMDIQVRCRATASEGFKSAVRDQVVAMCAEHGGRLADSIWVGDWFCARIIGPKALGLAALAWYRTESLDLPPVLPEFPE